MLLLWLQVGDITALTAIVVVTVGVGVDVRTVVPIVVGVVMLYFVRRDWKNVSVEGVKRTQNFCFLIKKTFMDLCD